MRTTLNIGEDVLRAARSLARERGQSLGDVVSDLARKGLGAEPKLTYRGSFPVFQVREGAPPITPEMVEGALDRLPSDHPPSSR